MFRIQSRILLAVLTIGVMRTAGAMEGIFDVGKQLDNKTFYVENKYFMPINFAIMELTKNAAEPYKIYSRTLEPKDFLKLSGYVVAVLAKKGAWTTQTAIPLQHQEDEYCISVNYNTFSDPAICETRNESREVLCPRFNCLFGAITSRFTHPEDYIPSAKRYTTSDCLGLCSGNHAEPWQVLGTPENPDYLDKEEARMALMELWDPAKFKNKDQAFFAQRVQARVSQASQAVVLMPGCDTTYTLPDDHHALPRWPQVKLMHKGRVSKTVNDDEKKALLQAAKTYLRQLPKKKIKAMVG